jgi:hypothetical protein
VCEDGDWGGEVWWSLCARAARACACACACAVVWCAGVGGTEASAGAAIYGAYKCGRFSCLVSGSWFRFLSLRRLISTAPDDIVDRVDFTEKELCNRDWEVFFFSFRREEVLSGVRLRRSRARNFHHRCIAHHTHTAHHTTPHHTEHHHGRHRRAAASRVTSPDCHHRCAAPLGLPVHVRLKFTALTPSRRHDMHA